MRLYKELEKYMRCDLSGRRIFVTGGTGFIGRTLLDYFCDLHEHERQQFQVAVLTRNPEEFLHRYPVYGTKPWLRFVHGRIENIPELNTNFTDVIHAAADTHLQGGEVEWMQQIVNGTQAVLQFAAKCGAKRFLLTSSGAVYGPQPPDVEHLDENYHGAPDTTLISSTYGQAKRVAEQLCTIYYQRYGIETVLARCFAFAGKHLPLDGPYAFGNFIRDALYNESINIKGDGTAIRSYLDGEDMAHWLISLLCRGEAGEAYNVGSDHAVTIGELANTIAAQISPAKPVIIENSSPLNSERSRYVPCINKIKNLGLFPQVSLEESIRRVASTALLNHP